MPGGASIMSSFRDIERKAIIYYSVVGGERVLEEDTLLRDRLEDYPNNSIGPL